MKKILTLILFLISLQGLAQTTTLTVKGKVYGRDSLALSGAAISGYEEGTNKKISTVISNENGAFSFSTANRSMYLTVSCIGYIPFKVKAVFDVELKIYLKEQTQQLKEVAITTKKPFIEQQIDRTVINVNGNLRAGINAVDILKKVPGIAVINGTDIVLENKGVNVMIDGKSTRMSNSDLMNLLNGTSPATISQIEVIHSPSAKSDAQSDGAIINIKTLKRQTPGYDMNLGLTTGHGWKYPADHSVTGSLTFRSKNNYLYGSYNYSFGKQSQEVDKRTFLEAVNQRLEEKMAIVTPYKGDYIRTGWDHYFKNKDIFGVLVTGYHNNQDPIYTTGTNIYGFNAATIDSTRSAASNVNTNSKGININLNYKISIDSIKNQGIVMDADIGIFKYISTNDLVTQLYNLTHQPIFASQQILQNGETLSKIYSYKADYTQKLKNGNLDAGIKSSYVDLRNDFISLSRVGGAAFKDQGSNDFQYQETLLAAYVSARKTFKKFTVQTGLRAEQTITNGNSITLDSVVKRSYINLFPSLVLGYKFNKTNLSFSYSRRIGRPSYNALNPFVMVKSAYSLSRGNPYLGPSFTNSYRFSYALNNKFSAALSFSEAKDIITDLQEVDNQTKNSTSFKANLNKNRNAGIYLGYNTQWFKFWDFSISVGSSLNRYQFNYANENVIIQQLTASSSINNHFNLKKDWWADLSFYGQSRVTYGNQVNLPFYTIGVVGGKSLWKNKATLSLSINDILFSSITRSEAKYGNVNYNLRSQYDSRNFRLNFNYRFGNSKINVRNRNSGSSDEQNRTQ